MQEATLIRSLADVLFASTSGHRRGRKFLDWNSSTASGCLGNEVREIIQHERQVSGD